MYNSEPALQLCSTGQRVYPLYESRGIGGEYVRVRIPAEFCWHKDRFQSVRRENLREVKPAIS